MSITPTKPRVRNKELLLYFILVFAWIWGIAAFLFLLPNLSNAIFGPMSGSNPLFILAVWGPNIVALTLTALFYGKRGVLNLLRKYTIWKVPIGWYLFILVGLPAVGLAAALLAGTFSTSIIGLWNGQTIPRLLPMLLNLLITGALGEELGWRGFALPRLLQKWNALTASLILGALWGLWHLPAFLAAGTPQSGLSLPAFVLGAIVLSSLTTWVFIHTNGSLLLCALIHFMANFSLSALGAPMTYYSVLLLLVVLLVIAIQSRPWLANPAFRAINS